jgi:hypothetical protein
LAVPAQKSQHFVPQFYLRNFGHGDSSSGLICIYNRRTKAHFPHAPIKSQACANYFYEKGAGVESDLASMENRLGPLVKRMIKDESPPKWDSVDHAALLKFIVFQSVRTMFAKEEADENNYKTLAKIAELCPGQFPHLAWQQDDQEHTPRMLLSIAEFNYHAAADLRCKLLRNKTGIAFITSDHPVVKYNQYFEEPEPVMCNTGLNCRGLQLFVPLNPKYLLVLFDSSIYQVGERNFKVVCVDVTRDDVNELNTLQLVNAGEHLYFGEDVTREYLGDLVKRSNRHLKAEKATVRTGPAIVSGEERGTVVASSLVDIRIGLHLSCMEVTPKAKERYSPSYHPSNRYRDLALQETLTDFAREVSAKRLRDSQFEEFRQRRQKKQHGLHSEAR